MYDAIVVIYLFIGNYILKVLTDLYQNIYSCILNQGIHEFEFHLNSCINSCIALILEIELIRTSLKM